MDQPPAGLQSALLLSNSTHLTPNPAPLPPICPQVVLLARDTPPNAPAVRDLGVDMSQWQPIIEDRCFVPWLVKPPGDEERLRARRLTPQQIGGRLGGGLRALQCVSV
jgi:hypothetical protein